MTPGARFRAALSAQRPLLLPGLITPFMARQFERHGLKAGYVSGAGVSNFLYGIPDVGVIERDDMAHVVRTMTRVSNLPLLVDVDTGWDNPQTTTEALIAAGAAALHIEDQTEDKRCGHLDGKSIVSADEMCARIRAAVKGKTTGAVKDTDFIVMARTDAFALEGLNGAISRMVAYVEAGADAIFAEAMTDLAHYDAIRAAIGPKVPLLANITEFGKTELYTAAQLAAHSVDMMLMPVSLARAMHGKVDDWLPELVAQGTTQPLVTRHELKPRTYYNDVLGYDPKTDNRTTVLARLMGRRV